MAFAALSLAASCAPRYLTDLAFLVDGNGVRVWRASGEGLELAAGVPARFTFERAAASGAEPRDFSVVAYGDGQLDVRLYAKARDRIPAARGAFTLLAGKEAELRLAVPAGIPVSSVELTATGGAKARVSGFATRASFSGAIFAADSYTVDAETNFLGKPWPKRLTLRVPATSDASVRISLKADGTVRIGLPGADGGIRALFEAYLRAGSELAIPVGALGDADRVSVESEAGVAAAFLEPGRGAPLADLHAILAVDLPLAGDYALYRWDILPETLVFDFADYDVQDRYLKRLAFFAEKPGFRGRLALDHEIEALHGWNAHDYPARTLAAFFSKALESGFRLSAQESALLEVLVSFGLLARDADGTIGEGRGAMISISRESPTGLRRTFLDHESSHALFFQDADYRTLSAGLWASLGTESRRFWIRHLAWRRYDTSDEYLCVNELQAYLTQQSTGATGQYYEAVARRLVEAYPEYEAAISSDAPYAIEAATADARTLDGYLRSRWGLSAGRFGRIRRP